MTDEDWQSGHSRADRWPARGIFKLEKQRQAFVMNNRDWRLERFTLA
jgi:hypothetical protein